MPEALRRNWSERRDSNPRPPVPQTDALPDCATLRPWGAVLSAPRPRRNAVPAPTLAFAAERSTFLLMIAFADLLERLVFTPSRNAKIALLRRYFATEPDPDRGIGLAAITGELSFTAAKPGLIRDLAASPHRPRAVRLVLRLCRRPRRDRRPDLAGAAERRPIRRASPRWWKRWKPRRKPTLPGIVAALAGRDRCLDARSRC